MTAPQPDTYILVEIVESDEATFSHVVPRGRTYPTLDSAKQAQANHADASGRVKHYVGAVYPVDGPPQDETARSRPPTREQSP